MQKLFRPPYGHQDLATRLDSWRLGYQVVTWNLVAQDWLNEPAATVAERVAERLQPGSIVLLHDALYTTPVAESFDREPTLHTVEMILQQFRSRFRFVTVPELMQHGEPYRKNWQRAPDIPWLNALHYQNGQRRRYT
jgi:peptidoglycan/xylan/chitin deacetylase (PgdA/CDA1 family)